MMAKKLHTRTLAPCDEALHFIKIRKFTLINKMAENLKITFYGFRIIIEGADKGFSF